MLCKLFALFACVAAVSASGGIDVSVSSTGINYIVTQLLPVVEKYFSGLTIPGISGSSDGFDYNLNDIQCPSLSIPQFDVSFAPPDQLAIALGNVGIQCHADYWYKPHGFPNIFKESGSVSISASQTNGAVTVALEAASLEAQLGFVSGSLSIGSLNLSFSGNWLDWLVNLFKPFIENAVKSEFDSKFPQILSTVVAAANTELAKLPTAYPLPFSAPYNIAEVRYGLMSPPTANLSGSVGYIGVSLQGDIVKTGSSGNPPITPPALPPFDASSFKYYLEMQLSPYSILSAVYTYLQADLLHFSISAEQLPFGFNSTKAYSGIVPGFPTKYPGGTVSIALSIIDLPVLTMTPAGITTQWPFQFSFLVVPAGQTTPVPAFEFVADATMALNITVAGTGANLVFSGDLKYLYATLTAGNSTVGPESGLPLIQDVVDALFSGIVVPSINKFLVPGIPLPSIPGLTFTDSLVSVEQNYVLIGLNFQFNPSTGAVDLAAAA